MVCPVSIKKPRGIQDPPSRDNSDVLGSCNDSGAHFYSKRSSFNSNISCQHKKYPSLSLRPRTRESQYIPILV